MGKNHSRKQKRTKLMEWNRLIRNTPLTKPLVGKAGVMWGTNKDNTMDNTKSKAKSNKSKKDKKENTK